ncbi:putative gtpase activating protein [Phaeoacremonium minimum UCRPA7]|uniref:Putative gtpase activating protein n=1 Tax=Phaeoacremonium minimum (strain UCR-PA7) TaxID=1286976 RepID=R8BAV8_PHAM7|nr:putative gtpase activating protein [Phaeoacremonium minimum UCRPA7]EON96422.1 putative gtpase activating protein [Phaeoacremonium minimum UCRPA7]
MAETLREEEDMRSERESRASDASDGFGRNLQSELENSNEAADQDTQSSDEEEVDWEQLQETEEKESKDQDSDTSTAMLLARLEQENDKLATNPKSVKVQVVQQLQSGSRRPRPPSMAQLRDMVHGPTPPALRYSMLPPPPMTDLEFYAALVKDYQQTAARLPTLLSNKIRKGVPPPLRGVVWQSMSGSRDSSLEEQYERFSGESSPYEGIIGKDLGRSFPGVDMFRDPEGDGQRMLGRVLKCYSLYDQKIGYCQGLAFLVGPLLMHMTDKQAFCVLVKLMENYDLRNSFTPDLPGLHVRIYQFRELLRQNLPILSNHLDDLQVDPAYVSQWFLSFFAVTCPLPMLFRIYDVVFAEGASETIMRVALSLMRKNQGRILACTEMEDVLQLLLSRGLWDCYHYNADEFVQDFVSLSSVVTRSRLQALEQGYREAQVATGSGSSTTSSTGANVARASEVTTAASRFLGRLWANSTISTSKSSSTNPSNNLSPGLSAPLRPLSMLRRSTSKQSLASTLNSMEASSSASSAASVLSSASTDATSLSRDSSAADDSSSIRESGPAFAGAGSKLTIHAGNNGNSDNKYLHSQIEDLLTALSELQRQHALLADQLQREREDRGEDRKVVRSLLDGLRKKASTDSVTTTHSTGSEETIKLVDSSKKNQESDTTGVTGNDAPTAERLSELLDTVEGRFGADADNRRSSVPQTKSQLRDELATAKEQLAAELARSQDAGRRAYDLEQELSMVKEQLRESHSHVRNMHQDKQRLEKQIHGMRVRASAESTPTPEPTDGWFSRGTSTPAAGGNAGPGGLRELKLGRSKSTPSQVSGYNKRNSSLLPSRSNPEVSIPAAPLTAPVSEHDALLLELVQAKTAEAIARQEAEEAKQKLEMLRKAFGLAPGDLPPATHNSTAAATTASAVGSAAMGMFSRFTASTAEGTAAKPAPPSAPTAPATTGQTAAGGFWGWRR